MKDWATEFFGRPSFSPSQRVKGFFFFLQRPSILNPKRRGEEIIVQIYKLRIVITDLADQRMLTSSSACEKVQKQADSCLITIKIRRVKWSSVYL